MKSFDYSIVKNPAYWIVWLLALVFASMAYGATTYYVDTGVVGGAGDGSSWANAYSSLSAAEDGRDGDITGIAGGVIFECRCSTGVDDSTAVTINGWTTDSDSPVTVQSTDHTFVLSAANGDVLSIIDEYVIIKGITIQTSAIDGDGDDCISISGIAAGNLIQIQYCTFIGANNGTYYQRGIVINDSDVLVYVTNSLFYNISTIAGNVGIYTYAGTSKIYNCTVSGGYRNYTGESGTTSTLKNCLGVNSGAGYAFSDTTGMTTHCINCMCDDTSFASQTFDTETNCTDSATNSFWYSYRIDGNDAAKDAGIDLSADTPAVTDDIDGRSRGATYDIGCSEYEMNDLYELFLVRDGLSASYVLTGSIDMEDTNPSTKPDAYNAGTTYGIGELCTHTHGATEQTYFSKTAGNVGNDPCDTDTTYWRVAWTTSEGWLPIGTDAAPFTGSFTGTSYTLSNMVIVRATTDYVGLFGYVGSGGWIQDLGIEEVTVTGTQYTGGLVGYSMGTVTSCYAAGTVQGTSYVGGLIGDSSGAVTGSYSESAVTGTSYVGGLIGRQSISGSISYCHATGSVTNTGIYTGGLVGYCTLPLSFSYATGVVLGTSNVGGLVGLSFGGVTESYAQGAVTGSGEKVGGFAGRLSNSITRCYATSSVSNAGNYTGGFAGIISVCSASQCYATGNVSGTAGGDYGGFVGYNYTSGIISDCYSKGSVTLTGTATVPGGFVGLNANIISNCYSTGAVSASGDKSGFCHVNDGTVTACFWDTTTSGLGTSTAGTGFATAYMVTPYESGDDPPINPSKPYYGWGWGGNAWQTDPDNRNGGYPILGWQTPRAIIGH